MTENSFPWNQPDWLETVHTWIHSELQRCNISALGPIEQPHIRPWSTVLKIPTTGGWVYFKATAPCFGHETALTQYLAHFAPELLPQLLAVDLERRWLLMRDSGTPLRAFIKESRSIERWQAVLPLYIDLQKNLASHQTELLELGVFDRRLSRLPEMFAELVSDEPAMLLDQPESLTTSEYRRLRDFASKFERMCARLASFGIPETLHHDDFHDGNIFIQDEQVILTDWGESAVSHPFFSLVVMLRGLENTLDLQPDAPELITLHDWYLSYWREYAPLAELQPVVRLAQQIGLVNRALTWRRLLSQLPEDLRPEYAIAVPSYLQEFIQTADEQ